MMRKGVQSIALVLLSSSVVACDFIVEDGEVLELDNGITAQGPSSQGPNPARPAVDVRPGGTLVVHDAEVSGGDFLLGPDVSLTDEPFVDGASGPGIDVNGGVVFVNGGRAEGGSVIPMDGVPVVPIGAPGPRIVGLPGGAGVRARDAIVSIAGGSALGGGGSGPFSQNDGEVGVLAGPGPALAIDRSTLMISGGEFVGGTASVAGPISEAPPVLRIQGRSALVSRSNVLISGGTFSHPLEVHDSFTSVVGGTFTTLFLNSASATGGSAQPVGQAGCAEIRGGSFEELSTSGPQTVFFFGTGFNLPLGPVQFPDPPIAGAPILLPATVSGTFVDGTSFTFSLISDGEGTLILSSPGDPGCPSEMVP